MIAPAGLGVLPGIASVRSSADLAATVALFEAYAASIGVDLGYQGFEAELAGLPGRYAPPDGALLLARDGAGTPIGCVAMRALADGASEMKRLYVAPEGRGLGLGRALIAAIVAEARRLGYREIRLDTLQTMAAAIALYRDCGFRAVAPYYETPVAGTLFFAKPL